MAGSKWYNLNDAHSATCNSSRFLLIRRKIMKKKKKFMHYAKAVAKKMLEK